MLTINQLSFGLAVAVLSISSVAAGELDGQAILDEQCATCHSLSKPQETGIKALWQRKGPDLASAGIKYKAEWLRHWLQAPVTVRPAGVFYGNHIKVTEKGDEVDVETLVEHIKLSADQADAVVETLMTLKADAGLVKSGEYQPGSISMTMGEMLFDKFKGCLACHQIEPGYGGLSGPEVYTIANRLQEDYLISYMRNPQAFDPKTIMPNKQLKDKDLQKLVHYFKGLAKEAVQ